MSSGRIVAVTCVLVLLLPVVLAPQDVTVAESTTELIREGGDWSEIINLDNEPLWYKVVVNGDALVDVYISEYFYIGVPDTGIDAITGHRHEGVNRVEDTVEERHLSLNLIVDNSNLTGVEPTGEVEVTIEWEVQISFRFFLLGIFILIGIVIGLALLWYKRRADRRLAQVTHMDLAREFDQVLSEDEAVEGGGDPETREYCPGCGRTKRMDRRTRRTYCPSCEGPPS